MCFIPEFDEKHFAGRSVALTHLLLLTAAYCVLYTSAKKKNPLVIFLPTHTPQFCLKEARAFSNAAALKGHRRGTPCSSHQCLPPWTLIDEQVSLECRRKEKHVETSYEGSTQKTCDHKVKERTQRSASRRAKPLTPVWHVSLCVSMLSFLSLRACECFY